MLVFGEKFDGAFGKASGKKAIVATALTVVVIVIDVVSGNMVGGQIAFGIVGAALIALVAVILNLTDDSSIKTVKA